MRTAVLFNGINSGELWRKNKKTINIMSRIKVHMKGRQRSEFKIWKLMRKKIQFRPLAPVA